MSSPHSVDFVKVTNENRTSLAAAIRGMYEIEGCGICEKSGAEVFWFSSISRCAHSVCYGIIKNIEANLVAKINTIFEGNGDRNMAHVRAVEAVKKELGGVSIKTYLEINGAEKLKSLFDSAGLKAALSPPSRL